MRPELQSILAALACAGAAFGAVAAVGTPDVCGPLTVDRGAVSCGDAECEALEADRVVLGVACGPERLTMYAREEDELPGPRCEAVLPVSVVGEW